MRARPCCGTHTLERRLFETVAREWKQLFSLSHFHSSALNISHGILCVFFPFSLLLGFQHISFSVTTSFSFSQSFPFPLSLSLAFGLFTAYFDAQPISCQHGPCRRSAKGYFLRLRVCVCVNGFDLLSTTGPHFPCAACRPAAGPGLRRAHVETTSSMFFLQSLQSKKHVGSHSNMDAKALAARWKLYYLNNPFSYTDTGMCASFRNQCSVQAVRGDLGKLVTCMTLGSDSTLHRHHKSRSSASQAFHTIQEYKTECKVRKEPH